jgi:hypothetical protein
VLSALLLNGITERLVHGYKAAAVNQSIATRPKEMTSISPKEPHHSSNAKAMQTSNFQRIGGYSLLLLPSAL